ncbi:MAG: SUMF1/EgtB/PvdO family nonheme iron enzyme, partial [Prochlorotrichaceae cyanobacterium]
MSEGTQEKIQARNQAVQINALLVTARYVPPSLESLWKSCQIKLNPMLLRGDGLYRFVQDYLDKRGAQNLLGKGEDFEVCSGLTRMAANRNITALLATLYIDQLLGWENGEEGDLPESTPILMLTYVNKLNRAIADRTEPWKANWAVQRDLQAIAWCCVQNAFYPANAPRQKVLDQLEQIEADTAPARLTYLVQRLNLVRVYEDGSFRVSLDPLAEYLAALHLIADLAADEQRWRELLQRLDATVENSEDPGAATAENRSNLFQAVRGFLLALRDCCQDKERQHPVPDWLVKALGERAGLDEATLLAEQQRYRLKRLMGDLSVPEPEDRARAAQELGKLGSVARKATARLRKVLNNTSEVAKVRREAGKALLQVGEAIPLMVVEFEDGQEQLHLLEHPPQRIVTLPNNVPLELVEITVGEFWMGDDDSDPDESPQHRVQILHCFWMGKYPITQAQWQAVARLPQVEQGLDPDPSVF